MKRLLLFVTLSYSIVCCTPASMDQIEYIDYKVLDWEAADFSSFKRFDPAVADFENLLFFLDKKLTFRVAAISYPTVDPNGESVWASGLVYHPIN